MSKAVYTPGGNPVCPDCGCWYLGVHDCPGPVLTGQVPADGPEHIDHAERCCREHGTHSNPHKGCILR